MVYSGCLKPDQSGFWTARSHPVVSQCLKSELCTKLDCFSLKKRLRDTILCPFLDNFSCNLQPKLRPFLVFRIWKVQFSRHLLYFASGRLNSGNVQSPALNQSFFIENGLGQCPKRYFFVWITDQCISHFEVYEIQTNQVFRRAAFTLIKFRLTILIINVHICNWASDTRSLLKFVFTKSQICCL